MNTHAADLLEQSLVDTDTAAKLPSADEIASAFEDALERQQDIYDQILLPRLGLGERLDLRPHSTEVHGESVEFRGGEVWIFDARSPQSWLHAPLLIPFEDLDDTLTLVRRRDVPAEVAQRLRPPMVPGVRRALESLDWLVVDTGGYEGGRMKHAEFLDEIGERRWFRIDHDPKTSAARFEYWQGEDAQAGWSANAYDAFECSLVDDPSWETPAMLADNWEPDPDAHAFEAAVALDLLDDPYALLRRLLWQDARLDVDRLGPLVTWKDRPDALFEFSDSEDGLLSNLAAWFGAQFDADTEIFEVLVDDWFARIGKSTPVELPGVGVVHRVRVPAVDLIRPRSLLGRDVPRRAVLARQQIFAADPEGDADWVG